MQGRIKRGGGGPGDPADREAAIRQQQQSAGGPTAAPGRAPAGAAGQKPSAGQKPTAAQKPTAGQKPDEAEPSRIGRIAPKRVSGMRRYGLSNWRIRTRLIALLTLPVIAASILGGLRIQSSLQTEQSLAKVAQLGAVAQDATNLATALETERDAMAGQITSTGERDSDSIQAAQYTTTTVATHFITLAKSLDLNALPGHGADITAVLSNLGNLKNSRASDFAMGTGGNITASVSDYDNLIQQLLSLSQNLALASSNSELLSSARSLEIFSQWKESVSIVQAVISASLASGNVLETQDRLYAQTAFNNESFLRTEFIALYNGDSANLIQSWTYNTNIKNANQFAGTVLNATNGFKAYPDVLPSYSTWDDEAESQITSMTNDENYLLQNLINQVIDQRSQAETDVILNSVLIALVLLVAVLGAALVARSMVRTLNKLQFAAEDVAEHQLPELVRTLSESDPQDVDTSVASIGIDTTDEIGHVARAFDQVHAQAVRLAAEQALLRGNINAMFTNLSRRSQGLIQRQLSMISELESREADPDQLASLFKLDHLATRMRRNGENLLVLAGEDPGRRWTRPVPLVDVLRAAASEVEQYERIELASVPTAEVAGRVVNDLVHLLAELLENATSFSSPQTRVRVTGHALPDGRVLVEIHDTGIGLSPDDLAEINERLANPPVVDVSVSRRMGLFVVGRLSLRHGIRIQLRPSDSGGTTALVMLPVDVTNTAERRGPGGGPGAGQLPGQMAGQGAPGQLPGQSRQRPQGMAGLQGGPQRGAVPQAPGRTPLPAGASGPVPGRPSLPGQPPQGLQGQPGQPPQGQSGQQQGLPPRRPNPTLPQGSTAITGQHQLPRRDQQQPQQPAQQQAPQQPVQPQAPQQPQPQQGRALPTRGQRPQPPMPAPAPAPVEEANLWAEQPQHGSPDSTAQFARPHFEEEPQRPVAPQPVMPQRPVAPQPVMPQPVMPPQPVAPQPVAPQPVVPQQPVPQPAAPLHQDPADHPLTRALPPAEADAARSPIFEAMESNWFRSGKADRMRAVQVYGDQAQGGPAGPQQAQQRRPQAPQQAGPQQPGSQQPHQAPQEPPQHPLPQRGAPAGAGGSSASAAAPWRASSNDEVWRRAEQVREPSAGGVMPSGLPRRVPQANLVPGAAESTPDNGPQVSRSPEEVRGRLTNLRRGIQQGRQAGSPNPSQDRSQDNGPYGTNPQER